jgi:hypothetical protein
VVGDGVRDATHYPAQRGEVGLGLLMIHFELLVELVDALAYNGEAPVHRSEAGFHVAARLGETLAHLAAHRIELGFNDPGESVGLRFRFSGFLLHALYCTALGAGCNLLSLRTRRSAGRVFSSIRSSSATAGAPHDAHSWIFERNHPRPIEMESFECSMIEPQSSHVVMVMRSLYLGAVGWQTGAPPGEVRRQGEVEGVGAPCPMVLPIGLSRHVRRALTRENPPRNGAGCAAIWQPELWS